MFWTGLSVSPGSPPPKISDRSQKLEMSQNAVKENDNVLNTGREVERRCMNLKDVKNLYKYKDMLHTHISITHHNVPSMICKRGIFNFCILYELLYTGSDYESYW